MVGQRTDIPVQDRILYRPANVQGEVSDLEGRLRQEYGVDYFAVARNRYPWNLVPDLVIGRPGYDNFLVMIASLNNVSVVDATQTLTALHQTDADGVRAGHKRNDSSYNLEIISRLQPLRGCSHAKCTVYRTIWSSETVGTSYTYNNFIIAQKRRRVFVERRTVPKKPRKRMVSANF